MTLKYLKNNSINGRFTFQMEVSLSELLGFTIEDLNDKADEILGDLPGSFSDINYRIVGHIEGNSDGDYISGSVILEVDADIADILEEAKTQDSYV